MVLENQIKNQENQNDDVEKTGKPKRVGLQLFKTFKIIEIGQKFIENVPVNYKNTADIRKPNKKNRKPEC